MNTKTSKAVSLFKQGMLKESYAIFKTFRIGFTSQEKRSIEIAYEALNGNNTFYQQIGIDVDKEIQRSKDIISFKYGCYNQKSITDMRSAKP